MRFRRIAVTWPHDMTRRELSSNHACKMQGRPTGYFLSEHVHVCEISQNSRTRVRARPGSARIGKVGLNRTVSPFVRESPDHSNTVKSGRRDWGVIGSSPSHWLAHSCARRARVVKTVLSDLFSDPVLPPLENEKHSLAPLSWSLIEEVRSHDMHHRKWLCDETCAIKNAMAIAPLHCCYERCSQRRRCARPNGVVSWFQC